MQWGVGWTTWRRSHGGVDVYRKSWGSQSTPKHGYEAWTVKRPSIGSRISTCWWMVVHMMSTHSGSTHCGLMNPDGSVDVPTMQGEVKLVRGWVPHGRSHHRCLAVLLADVERLIANGQKKLDWDVLMDSSKWSDVVCVRILVERSDMFVSMVWPDEGFVEQRLDVCLVPQGARPRATLRVLWRWWNFTRWRRMTWNGWSSLNWWLSRSRRLVHIALLGLVHKRLHTGLHCFLHLLHHLLCIEGCAGCRWCGLGCHRCWWIRHWSCRLGRMWMECWLMEWKKLLKVLDMCLSLYSQLLIQDVILLSESRQLCLSLSLELSLWLLVHKITATKLALKSHRLWVPEGPHVVGSGRKPARKHGSTVRQFNKLVQKRCIHKSRKDRDKAQRPSAVKFQPYRRLKYSTPELSAQFNLTNDHQKKEEPHLKHVLTPPHGFMSCIKSRVPYSLEQSWKRSCCRGFQLCKSAKKREPQNSGKLFNTHPPRPTCETRKNGQLFTLLRRITNSKV